MSISELLLALSTSITDIVNVTSLRIRKSYFNVMHLKITFCDCDNICCRQILMGIDVIL